MTAVLIRAHEFSMQEAVLAERLEAAFKSPVTFITDDSVSPVHTGRFAKVGIKRSRVRHLIGGRLNVPWGWLFGDVFYYVAREAFPFTSHFALIESDVFLSEAGAARLAEVFADRDEDALATQLSRFETAPANSKDLDVLGVDNALGCFFPVTRLSADAIDRMLVLRRREREVGGLRINDEAVLASVAFQEGVTSQNLSELAPDLFDPAGFTIGRTQLFEHLSDTYHDTAALHPVRNFHALLGRIEHFGGARNFRKRYAEAIDQAGPRQRRKLEQALAAADARREKGEV